VRAFNDGGLTNPPTAHPIVLNSGCNDASTYVIPPILDDLDVPSEDYTVTEVNVGSTTTKLERTYGFSVSNSACPVTGIVLTSDSQNVFTLTYNNGGSYTITLSAEASRTIGSYTYTATATADGGATAETTQTFTITRECISQEASSLDKSHSGFIPSSSSAEQVIFADSSSYV
jgi:hypothetical protein